MTIGIGFKISNVLETRFEEQRRQLSVVEFPLTKEEFYHIMRNRLKVSDRTIDGYWKFAQEIGLITENNGQYYIDFDVLFEEDRFINDIDSNGRQVKIRLGNDYSILLSLARGIGKFDLYDLVNACRSEGLEQTDEEIDRFVQMAYKKGDLFTPKIGYLKATE
ncbi:MAG: hypothetical protein PWQ62_1230 [Candidatus Methanomethylophilaceae archaeon]|nr:hypothetical protein [Candidatus Methanomethylophilaceae archaeon]